MDDATTEPDQPYWDRIHGAGAEEQHSWHQSNPERSLRLIRAAVAGDPTASVIDIGSGASPILRHLWDDGLRDLAALDISAVAMTQARARMADISSGIDWIVADITAWQPQRNYDVWHDRAVFHFLTDVASQSAYIRTMEKALAPGATAVLATFALDGPDRCSGLPVQQYDPDTLTTRLGAGFRLTASEREQHVTPAEREQRFTYAVFERL